MFENDKKMKDLVIKDRIDRIRENRRVFGNAKLEQRILVKNFIRSNQTIV